MTRFLAALGAVALITPYSPAMAQHAGHMPGPNMPATGEPQPVPSHAPSGHASMSAALGPYPMAREASGTAWRPDASEHEGLMSMTGGWMLMGHGVLNLVADHQAAVRTGATVNDIDLAIRAENKIVILVTIKVAGRYSLSHPFPR